MKKFLALVLALVMTMSLVTISAGAKDFNDAADVSYEEAVAVMSEIGVVDGDKAGNFNPTNGLTRGAAAKIICNLILGPTTAAELNADTDPYVDVAQDSTFAGYIAYCAKEGIVSGYADGTFKPAAPLTGYAFMKMLLGALGYDGAVEGYTGANWSINVAKQAIGIGLNAGLKSDFNGSDFVTREEAMLYAFNTLKATMVDYDTTITIGDITVAGSNEYDVANNAAVETIKNDNKMQFAEKYFSKLTTKGNVTDDFGRPAITWINNKTEIGTFVDYTTLAASYTTEVAGGEVYSDIGSAAAKFADVTYYIDGKVQNAATVAKLVADLKKGDDDTFGVSANGALTEVYVDVEAETIDVIIINTYLAEVKADYNEKKEYVSVEVANYAGVSKIYLDDVASIVDLEEGDMILVNIADDVVVNVMDPEVVADTAITKWSVGSYLVAGEQYDFAAKIVDYSGNFGEYYTKDALEDKTYNVYVDQYGYAIGIELVTGTDKYVFLAGYDKAVSNLARKTAEALVIFVDGTMANIEIDFNATNKALCTHDNDTCVGAAQQKATAAARCAQLALAGDANRNQWFKYTEDDGLYTLTAVASQIVVNYDGKTTINCENARVTDGTATAWGNDDSTYITVNTDTVDVDNDAVTYDVAVGISEVDGVYTGVQDVDLILDEDSAFDGDVIYALYGTDKYIDAAIVLGSEDDDNSKGYAYALKGAKNEAYKDGYYYWEFEAAVAGIVDTLTIKTKYTEVINTVKAAIVTAGAESTYGVKGLLKLTYDEDGYVTDAVKVQDKDKGVYGATEYKKGNVDLNPDDYTVYEIKHINEKDLVCSGRTLYTKDIDVGLTLTSGAPVIVIQVVEDEDGKLSKSIEEYATVAAALNALENEGAGFVGTIAADLNDKGTAEWIVLSVADVYNYVEKGTPSKPVVDEYTITVTPVVNLGNGVTDTMDEVVLTVTEEDLVDGKWAVEAPDLTGVGYTPVINVKNVTFVEGVAAYEVSFTYTLLRLN